MLSAVDRSNVTLSVCDLREIRWCSVFSVLMTYFLSVFDNTGSIKRLATMIAPTLPRHFGH
jgi:hypothetical protein